MKTKKYYEIRYDGDYSSIREVSSEDAFRIDEPGELRSDIYNSFSSAKKELIRYFKDRVDQNRYQLQATRRLKASDV